MQHLVKIVQKIEILDEIHIKIVLEHKSWSDLLSSLKLLSAHTTLWFTLLILAHICDQGHSKVLFYDQNVGNESSTS